MNQSIIDKIAAETNDWVRSILSERNAQNLANSFSQQQVKQSISTPQTKFENQSGQSGGDAFLNNDGSADASTESSPLPAPIPFAVCENGEPKIYLFYAIPEEEAPVE